MPERRCVFLDRDGTIIVDKDYLCDPLGVELLPGAAVGLRLLSDNGYLLVLISNQSGVGRGYFTVSALEATDASMRALLAGYGIELAGTYYCTHTEEESCACRKPATALVERATAEFGIDVGGSWVVGDKTSDVMLARNIGCRSILLATGKSGAGGEYEVVPDHRAADLHEAARLITGERDP